MEKKTKFLGIAFTPDEMDKIQRYADYCGNSRNRSIRNLIIKYLPSELEKKLHGRDE